ncbi:MAG: hypothetical protein GEU99_13045 [Luteitalea sp.]|nr:hypothetical protein [Luteitalea sp.]
MPAKQHAIKSDFARIDKLRDEDIDYSDIPELDDEVFAQPLVPWPPRKELITIRLDADVLDWFKHQGRGYQTRINQVLRRYMDVATRRVRSKARTTRDARNRARPSRHAR